LSENLTRRAALEAFAVAATPALAAAPLGGSSPAPEGSSALPGVHRTPFVRPNRALERLRNKGASVRDTGALGDGLTDDTAALQEIADHFGKTGGEWHFPPGVFRTSAPVRLDVSHPQRVIGCGARGVYPGPFVPNASTGLSVLMPVHNGRSAIQFVGQRDGDGSCQVQDLALSAIESGPAPEAALAWDTSDCFLRNFGFERCSVHGFTSAFDVYRRKGPKNSAGLFRAQACTINRNKWIARTLDGTQWNGFIFRDNEAGQNGYLPGQGGIDIAAHNVVISGNCLEGQRDPVRLYGAMQGATVDSNYFEGNVGNALIHLQNLKGPFDVGANSVFEVDRTKLTHLVLLTNCGQGRVLGPYWADGVHKMALPPFGGIAASEESQLASVATAKSGLLRVDACDGAIGFFGEPRHLVMVSRPVAEPYQTRSPWNGLLVPVAQHNTAQSPAISVDYAISGNPGEWLAASWLFRRDSDAERPSDPYLSFLIDGSRQSGARDYIAYNFDDYWRTGEWCVLTAAIKLEASISRLVLNLLPYGTKAGREQRTTYMNPAVYTTRTPLDIRPYVKSV
jgi:hypothetical protein